MRPLRTARPVRGRSGRIERSGPVRPSLPRGSRRLGRSSERAAAAASRSGVIRRGRVSCSAIGDPSPRPASAPCGIAAAPSQRGTALPSKAFRVIGLVAVGRTPRRPVVRRSDGDGGRRPDAAGAAAALVGRRRRRVGERAEPGGSPTPRPSTTPAATDRTLATACSLQPGSDVDRKWASRESVPLSPGRSPRRWHAVGHDAVPAAVEPRRASCRPRSTQPNEEPPDRSYSRRSAARARKTSVSRGRHGQAHDGADLLVGEAEHLPEVQHLPVPAGQARPGVGQRRVERGTGRRRGPARSGNSPGRSGRRRRCSSTQVLRATTVSQGRTRSGRPSRRAAAWSLSRLSWAASSAAWASWPSRRVQRRTSQGRCRSTSARKAASSPARRRASSTSSV